MKPNGFQQIAGLELTDIIPKPQSTSGAAPTSIGFESLNEDVTVSPIVFSKDEETEKPLPKVPIKFMVIDSKPVYIVDLFRAIIHPWYYLQLIGILETATSDTTIILNIGSPGGSVLIGTNIGSAMENTKATTIGVAVGEVASIAAFIWSCCDKHCIMNGTIFLYHMSTHGDHDVSTRIRDKANALIEYVETRLLKISIDKGLMTQEELDTIMSKSKDIIISCETMRRRLSSLESYMPVSTLMETYLS